MKCQKKSQSVKQHNSLECIPKQYENGQILEKFPLNEHQRDIGESSYSQNKTNNNQITPINSKPFIAESVVINKKMTSRDKSKQCNINTQNTKSSKTSVQGSISKEKTLSPFWTHHCKEWSKKLWSPVKTDCVDSLSNYVNGCSHDKEHRLSSWSKMINHQNVNYPMTSFPSFKFSVVGEMEQDAIIPKVFKVKLNPTQKQKKQLRTWESAYRFTYNSALDMKRKNKKLTKMQLRTMVVTKTQNKKTMESGKGLFGNQKNNPFLSEHTWLSKTPKDIRQQAAFEAFKNNRISKGKASYKVKNRGGWTIAIENKGIHILDNNKVRLYAKNMKVVLRTFGSFPKWLRPSEWEDNINPPCQALLQKMGQSYYMIFPYKEEIPSQKNKDIDGHMVGIDPGIRKFQTCFGTDGKVTFIGNKNPMRKFLRLNWYKDYILSALNSPKGSMSRLTGQKRQRARKRLQKTQERLENIRKDFHHKSAKWLIDHYKCIVIGKLPKGIISRDRSLPKSVKRSFNSLGHYKFRCCLKDKCQRKGIIYQEINESYTSKTCTFCGHINNVGSSETYQCDCQTQSWDRDINGARNILIKGISESYFRIVLTKDKTLSLRKPCWCSHPQGFSLGLNILKDC